MELQTESPKVKCMSMKKKERKKLQNWPKQSIISEGPDITWGWYRIGLTAEEERRYFQGDKKKFNS